MSAKIGITLSCIAFWMLFGPMITASFFSSLKIDNNTTGENNDSSDLGNQQELSGDNQVQQEFSEETEGSSETDLEPPLFSGYEISYDNKGEAYKFGW